MCRGIVGIDDAVVAINLVELSLSPGASLGPLHVGFGTEPDHVQQQEVSDVLGKLRLGHLASSVEENL